MYQAARHTLQQFFRHKTCVFLVHDLHSPTFMGLGSKKLGVLQITMLTSIGVPETIGIMTSVTFTIYNNV